MEKNEQEVEENLDLPETTEGEEDTTDWKAEATKLREKAIAQRERTKELKSKLKGYEEKATTKPENKPSGDLDNNSKALLVAYGIKGKDELALAQAYIARTGDDIDTLIEDDIFQAKLGKLREAKASQQATPSGTKRSATSTKDSVDYHLEKYESGQTKLSEMPFEMREKVLEKALERKKNSEKFTFN